MQKNDELILDIENITLQGQGVARADGQIVFVQNALPGERVRAHVVKASTSLLYAKAAEILTPSPDRVGNDCPAWPRCGGCAFRHMSYDAECRAKEREVGEILRRVGGVDAPVRPLVTAGEPERYRNKAIYPLARDADGRVRAGFYAPRSHRLIPAEDCRLQPDAFGAALAAILPWIEEYGIPLYDEEAHAGLLRYVFLRAAMATGQIMVCLVANGGGIPHADALIPRLQAALGDSFRSSVLNVNRARGNVALGPECRTLWGADRLEDRLCGLKVELSPLSFYQVNRDGAEKLYALAKDAAEPEGATLLDLYCGAGVIGLSMAGEAARVIGADVSADAVADARRCAGLNGIGNAEFRLGDASGIAAQLEAEGARPDVVLLDPPRAGCDAALIGTVADRLRPQRIVYVSCNPATLARDLALFRARGYGTRHVTPVNMFPRTAHVECVALLTRLEQR